ncbi:unnamed protein product [Pleuronectes platessa]|uniref:Uncharacterized protein n=1 Tax=Pleuronectes platessa TaxID=8262 RepID=A0A9N7VL76_PLEPL|nr:unnamed protein product [Pleuronectes platessa]
MCQHHRANRARRREGRGRRSFSGMFRQGGIRGFHPDAQTTSTDTSSAETLHKRQTTLQRDMPTCRVIWSTV